MRACVTGATGFVGSHIVRELLRAGHDVRALYRTAAKLQILEELSYEAVAGDVMNPESLKEAFTGCDWVFHTAAVANYWNADEEWMFAVNVNGTRNVLQAAREVGVQRVIFTSSIGALGIPPEGHPGDETSTFNLNPQQFPYGYSKVQAEEVVLQAVEQYGQDAIILNPAVITGPGDINEISGSFIIQGIQWQWLTPISRGGLSVIDVRDVAAAHLAAAQRGRKGQRYILSAANYENREWFGMVADVLGVAPPLMMMPDWLIPFFARLVDVLRGLRFPLPVDSNQVRLSRYKIYFDASKANEELHVPQIDMRRSLHDTFAWYDAQGMIRKTFMTKILLMISKLWH